VRAAQRRPRRQGSPAGRRAFLGDSADRVVGIGEIEPRNRSNLVRSIAPGTDVHLTTRTRSPWPRPLPEFAG
jgi:hypothetical protein